MQAAERAAVEAVLRQILRGTLDHWRAGGRTTLDFREQPA